MRDKWLYNLIILILILISITIILLDQQSVDDDIAYNIDLEGRFN